LTRIGLKGGDSLQKESEDWAAGLGHALKGAIESAGGQVADVLSLQLLKSDDELNQSVRRVQQKFAGVAVQMNKKPKGVNKERYTLGDEVALLPCAARADSLVFVHGSGSLLTGGRKTFSILTSGVASVITARSRVKLQMAFVDSRTGLVTALIVVDSLGDQPVKDPDQAYSKALAKELAELHFGKAASIGQTAVGANGRH